MTNKVDYNKKYFTTLKNLLIANENYLRTKRSNFPMGKEYVISYLNAHNIISSQLKMSEIRMEDLPTEVDWKVWYLLF